MSTAGDPSTGGLCYLGLGANLARRAANLARALWLLDANTGLSLCRSSSIYETAPEGITDQPAFLNMVAAAHSRLSPDELLDLALAVEERMGRVRTVKWGPRVIDIDLLMYDDVQVSSEHLMLPHPLMLQRQFVLVPLAEIAPQLRLPDGRFATEAARPDQVGVQIAGRLAQLVRGEQKDAKLT